MVSASPLARTRHMIAIELQGRLGNAVFLYSQEEENERGLDEPHHRCSKARRDSLRDYILELCL